MRPRREVDAEVVEDSEIRNTEDAGEEQLTLRDGSAVVIRPLERADRSLVQAVFDRMGDEARYRRFLEYKKQLSAADIELLTAIDHDRHDAMVALDARTGDPVGVARMLREPQRPDAAEATVAVVDAWQGRGLGSVLLERLVFRAREGGVRRFTAVLFAHNLAMLRLFGRFGSVRVVSRYRESLEIEVELPVATVRPASRAGQLPANSTGGPRRVTG